MKFICTILSILIFSLWAEAQNFQYKIGTDQLEKSDFQGKYEDQYGVCYEESLLLEAYDEIVELRNEIVAKRPKYSEVGNFLFEVSTGKTTWVKKTADKNCLSANPDDCLVWCLVDVSGDIVNVEILDFDSFIHFKTLKEKYKEMLVKAGFIVYSEISCDEVAIDQDLVESKLNKYFDEYDSDSDFMVRLNKFQLFEGLPIGGYNKETLDKLGL